MHKFESVFVLVVVTVVEIFAARAQTHGTDAAANFAGHYYVIRWGCGSECVMMAIADGETGRVYAPPLSGVGSELFVPFDNLGDMEVDLRPDSSLMVLRNACRDFRNRSSCGVYYFNWRNHRFELLKFVDVDTVKQVGGRF